MAAFIAWLAVLLCVSIGTALILELSDKVWSSDDRWRTSLVVATTGFIGLLALATLYRVEAVAELDGRLIGVLAEARGSEIQGILTVVTTMGDVVPTFLLASVLALVVFRQRYHRLACWLLPVLVLLELALQIGVGKVFDDETIASVNGSAVLGGYGYIPSGAVARLLAIFLFASLLFRSYSRIASRALATFGGAIVIVEATTRLYLGRHLFADIVAGLCAGLALAMLASLFAGGRTSEDPVGR